MTYYLKNRLSNTTLALDRAEVLDHFGTLDSLVGGVLVVPFEVSGHAKENQHESFHDTS